MTQSGQLAAIMFTDIVGYTVLMGNDLAKALEPVCHQQGNPENVSWKAPRPMAERDELFDNCILFDILFWESKFLPLPIL